MSSQDSGDTIETLSKEVIELLQKQSKKKEKGYEQLQERKRDKKKAEKAELTKQEGKIVEPHSRDKDGAPLFELGSRKKVRVASFKG